MAQNEAKKTCARDDSFLAVASGAPRSGGGAASLAPPAPMRSVDGVAARSVDAVERVSSRPRDICVAHAGRRGRRAPPAAAAAARRELSRAVPADRRHERVRQPRQRARAAAKVRRGVKPDDAHAPARRLRERLVRYSGLLLPPTRARLRARERLPRARAGSSAAPVRRGRACGQAGAAPARQALPGRGSSTAVRRLRSHRASRRVPHASSL